MRIESQYRRGASEGAECASAVPHRRGLSRGLFGGLVKVVMCALAFVYLGSVAAAVPLHMLGSGVPAESAMVDTRTGDLPDGPEDHGDDCLTCGLLSMAGTQGVASVPSQLSGRSNAVSSPRGLALTDRTVLNPRLRGPPVA